MSAYTANTETDITTSWPTPVSRTIRLTMRHIENGKHVHRVIYEGLESETPPISLPKAVPGTQVWVSAKYIPRKGES